MATVTSIPVKRLTTNLFKVYRGQTTKAAFDATVTNVMAGLGLTPASIPTPVESNLIIRGVYEAMATPEELGWLNVELPLTPSPAPARPVAILSN